MITTDPTAATPTWSAPENIDWTSIVDAMSCPSTSLCVAVDNAGDAVITTDPTAATPTWTTTNIDGTRNLREVSCASTSLCVAVGQVGTAVITTNPTAATPTWSNPTTIDGTNHLEGVSCASTSLCVAVDAGKPARWHRPGLPRRSTVGFALRMVGSGRDVSRPGQEVLAEDPRPARGSTVPLRATPASRPERTIRASVGGVSSGPPLGASEVIGLQRTLGNRAVNALLQGQSTTMQTLPGMSDSSDVVSEGACCPSCAVGDECAATVETASPAISLPAGAQPSAQLTSPRFMGPDGQPDRTLEACYEDRARLGIGANGEPVRMVQQALLDLGYDLGRSGADGDYGEVTAAAVRAFKRDEALGSEQYGDVGPGTMHMLDHLFPAPGDVPLCPAGDVVLAAKTGEARDVDTTKAKVAPLAAVGIPGLLCQIAPPINQISDIPEDVRKRMKVGIGLVGQAAIDDAYRPFTGSLYQPQFKPPATLTQTVLFGNGVPADPDVREGLRRVIFTSTGTSSPILAPMSTTTLSIGTVKRGRNGLNDLLPGGVFRFSLFKVGARTPAFVLIEGLGTTLQPVPGNPLLDEDRTGFETRWSASGYKLAGTGWNDKHRVASLDYALRLNPSFALAKLRGITFDYGPKPAGATEDGKYDPNTKTVILYFGVFDPNAQRPGRYEHASHVINHELGHALDDTFDSGVLAEFRRALARDGGVPITDRARKNEHESFAEAYAVYTLDPDEFQALRPTVSKLFDKRYFWGGAVP